MGIKQFYIDKFYKFKDLFQEIDRNVNSYVSTLNKKQKSNLIWRNDKQSNIFKKCVPEEQKDDLLYITISTSSYDRLSNYYTQSEERFKITFGDYFQYSDREFQITEENGVLKIDPFLNVIDSELSRDMADWDDGTFIMHRLIV